jgi:hypothetical protein
VGSIFRRRFFTWASIARSYDSIRLSNERREKLKLRRGEVDALSSDGHPHPRHVHLDARGPEHVSAGRRRGRSPKHGPNARDELLRAERLDDVIVGADLQADDAVGLVAASGQHDDGDVRRTAKLPGDVEAVAPGKPEIQHDQVGARAPRARERRLAVPRHDHLEPGVLEIVSDQPGDLQLVLHHEHRRHAHLLA